MSKSDHDSSLTHPAFHELNRYPRMQAEVKGSPWCVLVRHVLVVFLARVLTFSRCCSMVTSSALGENNKTARKMNKINYLISSLTLEFEFPSWEGARVSSETVCTGTPSPIPDRPKFKRKAETSAAHTKQTREEKTRPLEDIMKLFSI